MKSKTWCAYPFTHLATFTNGDVTPCCIASSYKNINLNDLDIDKVWNHDNVVSLRKALLNGEKVDNCSQCYKDESHGIESHRINSNRYFEDTYNITQDMFNDPVVDIKNLITLDLRLGNTCNLKCIMCRPNESHKWYEDIIKLQQEETLTDSVMEDIEYKTIYDRKEYNWINKKVFWNNIDSILPNIKEFIFGGGEPFMLKEVKHLLKRAVDLNVAKNINIRFHTNGTYLEEADFEVFKNFKQVQLMFSVDGIDSINYFLRYPADWNKIISTIELSETYPDNIKTSILCSLNSVSVYYLDRLYEFVAKQNWKKLTINNIVLGRVYHPFYLNPQILDKERKHIIKEKIQATIDRYPEIKDILESNLNWVLVNNDQGNVNDTISYITNILKIRNIDKEIILDFLEKDKKI